VAAFTLQAEKQATWQRDFGQAWRDTGLVITTRRGTPYEPRNFTRHFASRCSATGVRYITPYGMRRTCASLLAALDVHPRVAMRILRHSKIAVTMEITPRFPTRPPGKRFAAWESSLTARYCCTLLLHEDLQRVGPWSKEAADLGALGGTRTPNLLIRSKIRSIQARP
jgi:hypothetical protein